MMKLHLELESYCKSRTLPGPTGQIGLNHHSQLPQPTNPPKGTLVLVGVVSISTAWKERKSTSFDTTWPELLESIESFFFG